MSRLLRMNVQGLATAAAFLTLCSVVAPAQAVAAPQLSQNAPAAHISEEVRLLETYPFSEPNPVPILTRDPRLYPYHSFEGYSATSEPREWKVVKLENEYIEVFVLPEVGGKVWGAVVKETGHEFIYRNEVMKFRNIALRGPWTSGGIEFNFGVIGHAPATATPVDYTLVENPDGSVSCWVGSMDLPSRTHWRVEIRLPADRAYFETNVLWYNPTPLEQPYYNWMTAAAFARDDLEMSMPGDAYLAHSGRARSWPTDDEGRYLPLYGNNTFDGHKSYHVVGELNDFFGGYYHDEDYGFGHWARHEDMPGQKLWLWALSREGGVWEELLTDTDGQYVEFQAGRLFVQYSPGSDANPITQAGFDPMSASRWTESWFPLEGTGGLTDASREGALHAVEEGGYLHVGVNAFREIQDTLKVWSAGELVATASVTLEPLKPLHASFDVLSGEPFRVQLPGLGLDYRSPASDRLLHRPFRTDPEAFPSIPETDLMVYQARELMKGRQYDQSRGLFAAALEREPWNREALLGQAELAYRSAGYGEAMELVNRVLQLDAYDAKANFLAGIIYRATQATPDARDAFGWAARSVAYRSASYAQLAEIMIIEGDLDEAARYARLAIDFDRYSVPGWQARAVAGRLSGDEAMAREARKELITLDPLHHFVKAEEYLGTPDTGRAGAAQSLVDALFGEYRDQTLLELSIHYVSLGLQEDAVALLSLWNRIGGGNGPETAPTPMLRSWLAWLTDNPALLPQNAGGERAWRNPAFALPYRPESIPVLEWAVENADAWEWSYLLGLNLWAVGREEQAADVLQRLGQEPDFGPMYVARAHLLEETRGEDPGPDLQRAVALNPENRTLHIHLIRHYLDQGQWDGALEALDAGRGRFPVDFNLDLLQAQALMNVGKAREAAGILDTTHVLPSENARESHHLYEQAHTLVALDALESGDFGVARDHILAALEWPESLGQGKPYQPDERLVRFVLGRVEEKLGNEAGAREAFEECLAGAGDFEAPLRGLDLLTLSALETLGRGVEAEELYRAHPSEIDALMEGLDEDLEGRIILRALQMGGGQQ